MREENKKQQGFTLIEILVVIGIISILATIVLIALNPSRQFKISRDTQRTSNANALLNAIGQRVADNKGVFAGAVAGTTQTCPNLTTSGVGALTAGTPYKIKSSPGSGEIDLSCLVPTYIPAFPFDPSNGSYVDGSNYNTEYFVAIDANGRVTISAPGAEAGTPIAITR